MIIDTHAHYNHNSFKNTFRYLTQNDAGNAIAEGRREDIFQDLLEGNIPYSIELGVSLQSCGEVLALAAEYPGRIFPAMGVHPTRSLGEK